MKQNLSSKIVETIRDVANLPKNKIGLHEPIFKGNEYKYVKECLDTGWVSSAGKFVELFESKLVDYTQVKYAIATVNGTAALHLSLLVMGVKKNDEVMLPALTFIATANAVMYCQADPHFIDVNSTSLGVDPVKLDAYLHSITSIRNKECINKYTGKRIRALIVMHTFGHPVDLDKIQDICNKYHILLIEDAAEAIGSLYKGKHVGGFGVCSVLSFNGNKTITTGGGGAILTNSKKLATLAKYLTTTAKLPHVWRYYHDKLGFNYRMPNINAAIGCAQMEELNNFIKEKRNLADRYSNAFKKFNELKFFQEPEYARSNYWLNAILLEKKYLRTRDIILNYTNNHGVMTRPCWEPMNTLPMYKDYQAMDLSNTYDLAKRIINIPSSVFL